MDKNRQNPKRTSGRKIITDYDWDELEKRVRDEKNAQKSSGSRKRTSNPYRTRTPDPEGERQVKQEKSFNRINNQKRLSRQRIKAAVILVLAIVLVIILMFMTPIFNIKSIKVSGNKTVVIDEIKSKLSDLADENLFKVSSGNIRKRLKDIAYIDDVAVSRGLFPVSLNIVITECNPAAYIKLGDKNLILNSQLKILRDDNTLPTDSIPQIYGIEINDYRVGKNLESPEGDKTEILQTMLRISEELGLLSSLNYIDLNELTGIKMLYDDRLEVICGTQVELERKIRMFKETVSNNYLNENSRGTIDLSVTGKAVYTP